MKYLIKNSFIISIAIGSMLGLSSCTNSSERPIKLSQNGINIISAMYRTNEYFLNQAGLVGYQYEFLQLSHEEKMEKINKQHYNTFVKYNYIDPENIRDIDYLMLLEFQRNGWEFGDL